MYDGLINKSFCFFFQKRSSFLKKRTKELWYNLHDRVAVPGGHDNAIGAIRLIFAMGVIVGHSVLLTPGALRLFSARENILISCFANFAVNGFFHPQRLSDQPQLSRFGRFA
ncbi:MAG: hypothetical protein WDN04_12445 [Rhodospirillales bacterium]